MRPVPEAVHGIQRKTRQREAIIQVLIEAGRPLAAAELFEKAQALVPRVGLATVYRLIKLLQEEGRARLVELPGLSPHYEWVDEEKSQRHHHHFVCENCQRVFDVYHCPGGLQKMVPKGFLLKSHELTLIGVCDKCRQVAESA